MDILTYVPSQENVNYIFPDNNPDFYSEIIKKDGIVNAVSCCSDDSIYTGIRFSDFFRMIDRSQSEIQDITYVDLNLDSVYECVFSVPKNDKYGPIRIILSEQGDDIYAYYDEDPPGTGITKDGFLIEDPDDFFPRQRRVLYDKENWLYYDAPY